MKKSELAAVAYLLRHGVSIQDLVLKFPGLEGKTRKEIIDLVSTYHRIRLGRSPREHKAAGEARRAKLREAAEKKTAAAKVRSIRWNPSR